MRRLDRKALKSFPLPRPGEDDKNGHGRILSVAGGSRCPGALRLVAEAAMRAGAGKLQIGATGSLAIAAGVSVQEALFVESAESPDGEFAAKPGKALLTAAAKCDAFIVGPGMLDEGRAWSLAKALLKAAPEARTVIDAAAMTGCSADATAPSLFAGRAILAPHAGEMATLMGYRKEEVEANPLTIASDAAQQFQAVIVMKGATTHIVEPGGGAWTHTGGVGGLGVSGSGDVLAGLMGGLLARGCTPVQAALWGVYLHGAAGKVLSRTVGPLGFLAREISPLVPALMA